VSELAPGAPDSYTVKKGDTLWGLAGLFLRSPWRWPELWGMNTAAIRNPNLIYPGQQLYLDRKGGNVQLRAGMPVGEGEAQTAPTVKLSPKVRSAVPPEDAIPTLSPHLIEPFLVEPLVVDAQTLDATAHVVGNAEGRVLMTRSDRAYALGLSGNLAIGQALRIFREATPIKDPVTGEVLGLEAQYIGRALLARPQSTQASDLPGQPPETVPATVDIVSATEEIRSGDRLLVEPLRALRSYVPHAPRRPVDARVAAIYGDAVSAAGQNKVIALNRGERDGMDVGQILTILSVGERLQDGAGQNKQTIKLPDERNGLAMVFRTFDRVSYALILQITAGVKVGDRLVNPR